MYEEYGILALENKVMAAKVLGDIRMLQNLPNGIGHKMTNKGVTRFGEINKPDKNLLRYVI